MRVGLARADPGLTAQRLLEAADMALYQAKAGGRNRTCVTEVEAGAVVSLGPALGA